MTAPPGMNDELTEEGLWWLPEQAERRISGILTFNQQDGAALRLSGSFNEEIHPFSREIENRPVILGFTTTSKPVTLLQSLGRQRKGTLGGLVTETHKPHLVAIGHHFENEDEELFTKSFVTFEAIDEWLGERHFHLKPSDDGSSFDLRINRSRERNLATMSEANVSAGSSFYTDETDTDFTATVRSYLALTPPTPKSLKWHFSAGAKIQALASLCAGRHLPLLSLTLEGPEAGLPHDPKMPALVRVYAQMIHPESHKARQHEPLLLSIQELTEANSAAFQRWFDSYKEISSAIHLFLAVQGTKGGYMDARFTLAVQALEVFHRLARGGRLIDDEAHVALQAVLIAAIPEGTPERMREKLEGTLVFTNEPSLLQRLKAVMKEVEEHFGTKPPGYGKAFLTRLVDTRNYHTHYSPTLEGKALTGADMHYAIRRITLLLTVLILMRLGVGPETIGSALSRHREFKQLWERAGNPQ